MGAERRRSRKLLAVAATTAVLAVALIWAATSVLEQVPAQSAAGTSTSSSTSSTSTSTTSSTSTTAAAQPPPADAHILIVGDSLIGQARTPIAQLLGDLDVDIRAKDRTTVGQWALYLPGLIERESPDILVLALGTNDNLAYDTPTGVDVDGRATAYAERVEALLDATAGVPCRVWIEPSPLGFDPRYQQNAPKLNERLRASLAAHGVRRVSWGDQMARGDAFDNGWMHMDSIHLTGSGQIAYGALTAKAARDGCR